MDDIPRRLLLDSVIETTVHIIKAQLHSLLQTNALKDQLGQKTPSLLCCLYDMSWPIRTRRGVWNPSMASWSGSGGAFVRMLHSACRHRDIDSHTSHPNLASMSASPPSSLSRASEKCTLYVCATPTSHLILCSRHHRSLFSMATRIKIHYFRGSSRSDGDGCIRRDRESISL